VSLSIQKSAVKNFTAINSEIGSQTIPLSIQKSTTKNFSVVNSEIDNKTASLPIYKSAANYAAADSEIGSPKLFRC
jgi:hypothetical protein